MANTISKVIETITEYIDVKSEQIKLKVITRLAGIFSVVLSFSFLVGIGLLFVLFLSVAVAFSLNSYFENTYIGFYLVAGFYFLIIVLTFILVKTRRIQNWFEYIILKIAEKDEQDD